MALTHTFTHAGITITVHTRTGADELDADVVYSRVLTPNAPTALNYRYQAFSRIITQSRVISGDLGFVLPDAMATAAEHRAAYDALMARTDGLVRRWVRALDAVDEEPGDQDEAANSAKGKEVEPPGSSATGSDAST